MRIGGTTLEYLEELRIGDKSSKRVEFLDTTE